MGEEGEVKDLMQEPLPPRQGTAQPVAEASLQDQMRCATGKGTPGTSRTAASAGSTSPAASPSLPTTPLRSIPASPLPGSPISWQESPGMQDSNTLKVEDVAEEMEDFSGGPSGSGPCIDTGITSPTAGCPMSGVEKLVISPSAISLKSVPVTPVAASSARWAHSPTAAEELGFRSSNRFRTSDAEATSMPRDTT